MNVEKYLRSKERLLFFAMVIIFLLVIALVSLVRQLANQDIRFIGFDFAEGKYIKITKDPWQVSSHIQTCVRIPQRSITEHRYKDVLCNFG